MSLTNGQCYKKAALHLCSQEGLPSSDEWVLVHGYPILTRKPFLPFGHAWLEWVGQPVVWDYVLGLARKEDYYRIGQIDESENITYNRMDVYQMIIKHGHWGPWKKQKREVLYASKL